MYPDQFSTNYQQQNQYNPYQQGSPPPPVVAQAVPVSASDPYKKNQNDAFSSQEYAGLVVQLDTTQDRHAFIRKVYSILTVQLLITFGFVAFFTFNANAQIFIQDNPGVFFAALGLSFALVIVLSCCSNVARSYPWGPLFLMLFTVAESVIVGFLAAQFAVDDVLIAVGATFAIVFGLTLFACQTKYDITGWGPYLFVALLVLVIFSFVLIFIQESRETRLVFSALAVLLFSVYLVYDTQLIIGGAHKKYEFSTDDYVFAALNLYLDIINIFIYLLLIIGGGDN